MLKAIWNHKTKLFPFHLIKWNLPCNYRTSFASFLVWMLWFMCLFFCGVTLECSSFYFGNSIHSSFQPTRGKKQNKYDKIPFHTQLSTRQSLSHNIISQNNQLSGNISLSLQYLCVCLSFTRYPGFHRWWGAPWDAVVGYHCNEPNLISAWIKGWSRHESAVMPSENIDPPLCQEEIQGWSSSSCTDLQQRRASLLRCVQEKGLHLTCWLWW